METVVVRQVNLSDCKNHCGLTSCDIVDPVSKSLSMKALMWELFSQSILPAYHTDRRLLLQQNADVYTVSQKYGATV